MIKRNSIPLTSPRSRNIHPSAKEILDILDQKSYTSPSGQIIDISAQLQHSISNSVLHQDPISPPLNCRHITPIVEVVNEKADTSAARLLLSGKNNIVALNFASVISPGGGFLSGSKAQEEDLCRVSGLYYCLKGKTTFYNNNLSCGNNYYTDDIIYSPNVPFFRDEHLNYLEAPFPLSIITSPALNNRDGNLDAEEVSLTFQRRIKKVLQVAQYHGHKTLILGAWGCGAFGNDPEMVASIFAKEIERAPYFEHICFSVYDNREGTPILNTFKKYILANDYHALS